MEQIKSMIKNLYETNPNVHVSVKISRPKVLVEGTPARIVGVYKNIFQIEEMDSGRPVRHSFQYGDVLIGVITIEELDYIPQRSILNKK